MGIAIGNIKEFKQSSAPELFLSVKWDSAKYPDKLAVRNKNSDAFIRLDAINWSDL